MSTGHTGHFSVRYLNKACVNILYEVHVKMVIIGVMAYTMIFIYLRKEIKEIMADRSLR